MGDILPEINIETIRYDGDGLVNHIFIVNEETVVRFARGEYGDKALQAKWAY
jgi:putative lipase involved disintegration of autophagic bodies